MEKNENRLHFLELLFQDCLQTWEGGGIASILGFFLLGFFSPNLEDFFFSFSEKKSHKTKPIPRGEKAA